jgi:alkylation response protein AidB-like acyl-CoA dehydrogenase
MTGTAEFNEVFFDDARTAAVNVVGAPGDGWRIAKATLAIERGAAMLGQQVGFRRDFEDLAEAARAETIYGGSDEIQHEIIATRALGLPRS